MAEKVEVKAESLLNLDDLLQCPVCYEIPTGQIFQCNEGHHVCGRCKVRLDVCPVCRALFFGTRNYAMEELIANFRKIRSTTKISNKPAASTTENTPTAKEQTPEEPENEEADDEETNTNASSGPLLRAPLACRGLFRCLCCKNGNGERLPAARLLNHLRYFHAPDLIEGRSDNGEYLQAWQFSTVPGRIVTAVRVADMGVFFLVIEIGSNSVHAWLTIAASPWVANSFVYTVTISGNDREAIFTDSVSSVRSCEGSLKKRGHCLLVSGMDARALIAPVAISGKLQIRHLTHEQMLSVSQPRAVLRVANRGTTVENTRTPVAHDLEPFLQDLQNDVARLSRAFATLGREANALVRSEVETWARAENGSRLNQPVPSRSGESSEAESQPITNNQSVENPVQPMSRNARRRMRQRLRAALNGPQPPTEPAPVEPAQRVQLPPQRQNGPTHNVQHHMVGLAIVQPSISPPPAEPHSSTGPSNGRPQSGNHVRVNKKKRRQRR